MQKEIQPDERLASEETPTIRLKNEFLLRREREMAEQDAAEALRLQERDPAQFALLFVAKKLIFEAFIGHDDIFIAKEGCDPKTTNADETWLRSQAFLIDTEYLALLIEHTKAAENKIKVNNTPIFPVENLAPYRPNVLTPLTTAIVEVLFDHDEWVKKRVKENGELSLQVPTSKHRYGHVLVEKIGATAYEQICQFYLESVQEIARRKRFGGLIQQVEGKLPNEISPTILTQLTELGDTFEDAVIAYCKPLKPLSIIPQPYYAFMYKVGALVMSVIDPHHDAAGLPLERDIQKHAEACLAIIAQVK